MLDQPAKGVVMRKFAIVVFLLVTTGCQDAADEAAPDSPSESRKAPEAWVMSPDSFGPITVETTKAEALATGLFRVPRGPSANSSRELDWHTQTYSQETSGEVDWSDVNHDGVPDPWPTKDLPRLALRCDNKPGLESITPAPDTVTDRGIRQGSSLKDLTEAYGQRLIHGETFDARYAVNGERSHLVFVMLNDGSVGSFFINRGTVSGPTDDQLGRAPGQCE